jgi:hypothetical protein
LLLGLCLQHFDPLKPGVSQAERALIEHQQEQHRQAEEQGSISLTPGEDGEVDTAESSEAAAHAAQRSASQVDLVEMAIAIEVAQ